MYQNTSKKRARMALASFTNHICSLVMRLDGTQGSVGMRHSPRTKHSLGMKHSLGTRHSPGTRHSLRMRRSQGTKHSLRNEVAPFSGSLFLPKALTLCFKERARNEARMTI